MLSRARNGRPCEGAEVRGRPVESVAGASNNNTNTNHNNNDIDNHNDDSYYYC